MDGRDLLIDIVPNYNNTSKLIDIALGLPKFISRVISAQGHKFFGQFHLGSVYDMNNFEHMLISK
ncbi:MAG: hypothetical protein MJ252_27235 [archaeon]|nr:hypothetical protein [archaeon]